MIERYRIVPYPRYRWIVEEIHGLGWINSMQHNTFRLHYTDPAYITAIFYSEKAAEEFIDNQLAASARERNESERLKTPPRIYP